MMKHKISNTVCGVLLICTVPVMFECTDPEAKANAEVAARRDLQFKAMGGHGSNPSSDSSTTKGSTAGN